MKRLFITTASLLLLAAAAPIANAEPVAANLDDVRVNTYLTPFELVTAARRGAFEEQGIASYSGFVSAYQLGRVTSQDLVRAAVESNQLPAAALEDESYLNGVMLQLQTYRYRG